MKNAMFIPDDPSRISAYDERSGKGAKSEIPMEIMGWNWGAAGLSWIWGIGNKVWISFLVFIPGVGYIMWLFLGINGNEWAWKARKWESVQAFQAAQNKWRPWGIAVFAIGVAFLAVSMVYVTLNPAKGPFRAGVGPFSAFPSITTPAYGSETLEGKRVDYTVTFDRTKWVKSIDDYDKVNEVSEYELFHRDGDVFAEVIAERIGNVDSFVEAVLENVQEVAPDAEIVSEEKVMIGGKEITSAKIQAKVSGMPYFYQGYFYSGDEGSVQFIIACPQNLFDRYSDDMMELLNSLVIL